MNTKLPLLLILIVFAGCDQQPTIVPNSPPDAIQDIQPDIQTPEPEAMPESTPEADEIIGKVVGIVDGDTIDILTDDMTTTRIRLNGIDAPETGQPFGRNAKQYLSDTIGGKLVRIVEHDQDRYGRTIGDVYSGSTLVNVELVRAGLAWHYVQYAPDNATLAAAEAEARMTNRGLWSDARHVAPWEWRKLSKEQRDKLR